MLIYSFVIAGRVEVAAPVVVPHVTEPLWKLPFPGTRTDRGALSQGLINETAMYFVVKAKNMHGLIIPHNENESPRFHPLMEFDSSRCPTCAIGLEKAFIQHEDSSISRLSMSWEKGEPGSVVFNDYPTTCNGARIPHFDEETGRTVQDLRDGFRVIDTATLYKDGE
ncbi:hypothetical protein M413DRAFT_235340 [Hebeloma cylindrosporum]|uniref:Uncharacterized protein n=1 Tax=Hebeloma cylindrosporum TaxID=76867 RepID=A0A0C2YDE9_HEBCY|nr:hypothetical protein M413DRAFT_235340 [Hebeloma cylindrosporum h7]